MNLCEKLPTVALSLQDSDSPYEVARVRWEGTCDLTGKDLFSTGDSGRQGEATQEASRF